jgi:hypothetical protein
VAAQILHHAERALMEHEYFGEDARYEHNGTEWSVKITTLKIDGRRKRCVIIDCEPEAVRHALADAASKHYTLTLHKMPIYIIAKKDVRS